MVQPHEIMIGSCFNQVIDNFEPCTPKPIIWDETNWYRIGECIEFYEWFEPIPLTEQILVEWCKESFEHSKEHDKYYKHKTKNIAVSFADNKVRVITGNFVCSIVIAENPPLHLFQMLVQSLTNQPLKITLK